ncbi:pilus assembly protein Flp/PilA [Nakamurella panacisegetis]|uniref:Pilus assembly protein Flp/PilA n=1 Tax=Nakamurella panacisegetis TaxID=1090615 RepID=A0A1H0HN24_9ACTN|nr:Flp family type IVb pilin [Nakamurella panacisegetis]SDO20595.1 pilus assembly protein Flp/PilA [Nakamurella panacisegetis]
MNALFVTLYVFGADLKDRFSKEDRGATAVEYGLLVGLIAVVIIVAVTALGGKLTTLFTSITSSI